MVLDQAVALGADAAVRFAALVHDLGKGATPRAEWPGHRGHEERSVALIETLAARLRVPTAYRELALIVARDHGLVHRALELRPGTIVEMFERVDAFRRPDRFADMLLACEADYRGRAGLQARPYPQRPWLQAARDAAAAVRPAPGDLASGSGVKIAAGLRRARSAAIAAIAAPKP